MDRKKGQGEREDWMGARGVGEIREGREEVREGGESARGGAWRGGSDGGEAV